MEPIHSNIHTSNNTNKAQSNRQNRENKNNTDIVSKQPPITDNSNINQDVRIANQLPIYRTQQKYNASFPPKQQNAIESPLSDKIQKQNRNESNEQNQDQPNAFTSSNHKQFRPNRFKRFPRFTIIFKKEQNIYSSLRNTVSDPQTQTQKFLSAEVQNKRNKLLQQHQLKYFDIQSIKQIRYNQEYNRKRRNSIQRSKINKNEFAKNLSKYEPQKAIYINLSPHTINQLVIQQQNKQQIYGQKISNRSNNISSNQLTMIKQANTFNNISGNSLIQIQDGNKQHLKSKQSQGTSPRWGVDNQSLPPIARQLTSGIQLAPNASKQLIASNKTPRLRSANSAINFEAVDGVQSVENKKSLSEIKNMSSKNTKRTDQYIQLSNDEDDQGFKMFDPFERVLLTSSGGIDNAMITSTRTMQRLNNILSPFSYKIIHTNFIPKPISNFFKSSQKRSQIQHFGKSYQKQQIRSNSPYKKYQVANIVQNIGYIAPLAMKQKHQANYNINSGYMSDIDYVSSTLRESIAMGHQNQALWQAYLAVRGSQDYSGAQSVDTKGGLRFINGAPNYLSSVKEEERLTGEPALHIQEELQLQQQFQLYPNEGKAIGDQNLNDLKEKSNSPSFGPKSQNESQKQITVMQGDLGSNSRNHEIVINLEQKNKQSKDDSTIENSKITMGPINMSQQRELRSQENNKNLESKIKYRQSKFQTQVYKHQGNITQQKNSSIKKKRKYYTTSMKTPPMHVDIIQGSDEGGGGGGGLQSPPNQAATVLSDRKVEYINQSKNGQNQLQNRMQQPIAQQKSIQPVTQKQKSLSALRSDKSEHQNNFYIHTVAKESVQSLSLILQQSLDHQEIKLQKKKLGQSPLRIKMVNNKQGNSQKRNNASRDLNQDSLLMTGGLSKMQYAASKMATTAAKSFQKRQEMKINLVRPFDISRRGSIQQNAQTSFNWNNSSYKLKPQASAPRVNNAFVPKVVPKFMKKNFKPSANKPTQTNSVKNNKSFGVAIRNQTQALAQIPDFQDSRKQLYKKRPSTTGKRSSPPNFMAQRDSGSIIRNLKRPSQVKPIIEQANQQFLLNNSSIGLSLNNSIGQAVNDSLSQGTIPTTIIANVKSIEQQSLHRNSNYLLDENSIQDDLMSRRNIRPTNRGMLKIRQEKGEIQEIERNGASKASQVFKDGRRFIDYEKRTSSPVGIRNQEFMWNKAKMISFRKMSQASRKSTLSIGKKKSIGESVRRPNTGGVADRGLGVYNKHNSGIIKHKL